MSYVLYLTLLMIFKIIFKLTYIISYHYLSRTDTNRSIMSLFINTYPMFYIYYFTSCTVVFILVTVRLVIMSLCFPAYNLLKAQYNKSSNIQD
jgi:hypothetical protein